jgi:O-succinylbenzoate synthase
VRPTLAAVQEAAVPFAVPLRTAFRGTRRRLGLLIPGPVGWGEFAPFDDYPPALAGRWLRSALEGASVGWPAPMRDSVPVNAIVPALAPDDPLLRDLAGPRRPGPPPRGSAAATVKVKVTGDPDADQARVAAVRAAAGPSARIRLDVNAAWTLGQALQQLPALAAAAGGLEYVEQPLASLAEIAVLRRETGIAVAVDEGLRRAPDPHDTELVAAVRESADVAVLKVGPLGGVAAVLRLAGELAMPVVISGAMETSVGLSAGIAAACALPDQPLACGLGTGALLAADVVAVPIVPTAGRLAAMTVTPDAAALAAASAAVSVDEERRLRRRLAESWEYR